MKRISVLILCGAFVLSAVLIAQQRQAPPLPAPSQARPNPGQNIPRPEGAMPKVPAGFTVDVYFDNIQQPRMMEWAPNGDLFVTQTQSNTVAVLKDTNNDGTPDERIVFVQGPPPPPPRGGGGAAAAPAPAAGGGNAPRGAAPGGGRAAAPAGAPPAGAAFGGGGGGGQGGQRGGPPPLVCTGDLMAGRQPAGLAFQGGYLYVGYTDCVVRYPYKAGDTQFQGKPERLIDLPGGGNHYNRTIAFSRDGKKLYVAVGSASNNAEGEDVRRAAISEYNADGTGFRIYASGLRNPTGLVWQPGTNTLWTSVNERDGLGDDLVPDYITSVKDGGFYGWPFTYFGQTYDPIHVGKLPNLVKTALVPDVPVGAHTASLGMSFYTANQFPQRYRNGVFVAQHGSWNRSVANGYKVIFVPFANGRPGTPEDFLTGFVVNDGSNGQPITRWGRPAALALTRDGALLVSDDAGNRIWRIRYTGRQAE
jgi:glucose/arabinose dehydrogenase